MSLLIIPIVAIITIGMLWLVRGTRTIHLDTPKELLGKTFCDENGVLYMYDKLRIKKSS